jgi:hypothetical protein
MMGMVNFSGELVLAVGFGRWNQDVRSVSCSLVCGGLCVPGGLGRDRAAVGTVVGLLERW